MSSLIATPNFMAIKLVNTGVLSLLATQKAKSKKRKRLDGFSN